MHACLRGCKMFGKLILSRKKEIVGQIRNRVKKNSNKTNSTEIKTVSETKSLHIPVPCTIFERSCCVRPSVGRKIHTTRATEGRLLKRIYFEYEIIKLDTKIGNSF